MGTAFVCKSIDGYQADRDGTVWAVLAAEEGDNAKWLDPPGRVLHHRVLATPTGLDPPSGLRVEQGVAIPAGAVTDYRCVGLGWVETKRSDGSWQSYATSFE
jgi:hypothetical protein